MNTKRGVYFLANNYVIDFAIAFLNSFRSYNPDIPLCLIPYDSNYDKIAALYEKFNFTIFNDEKVINACDDISSLFPSSISGGFRKLAMWEGPFDEFIYIDVDTVVLSNLDFVFNILLAFDFITSHSSIPVIRKWVWKDSIYTASILNEEQINYAANTGFIISHKKALSIDSIIMPQPEVIWCNSLLISFIMS